MKKIFIFFCFSFITSTLLSQDVNVIQLNPPNLNRGLPVMRTLSNRASAQEFDTTQLSLQDISDLLWAANGINRKETGKRTAPSAMNAQDIDIYVFLQRGVYLYNPKDHSLELISNQDYRESVAGSQKGFAAAPLFCLLVSDNLKFNRGSDSLKTIWGAFDAGIVSQNISVFCASVDLSTRPRAYMDHEKLRNILNLKNTQHLMLNHPVSYKKK